MSGRVDDKSGDFFARFRKAAMEAIEAVGYVEVGAIKNDLSIPVEYVPGGVIRSLPDEPPRKETGKLQASVRHKTYESRDAVGVTIGAGPVIGEGGVDYSTLEFGIGPIKARPYMGPSMARVQAGQRDNIIIARLQRI